MDTFPPVHCSKSVTPPFDVIEDPALGIFSTWENLHILLTIAKVMMTVLA